jgi:hypothetical protein
MLSIKDFQIGATGKLLCIFVIVTSIGPGRILTINLQELNTKTMWFPRFSLGSYNSKLLYFNFNRIWDKNNRTITNVNMHMHTLNIWHWWHSINFLCHMEFNIANYNEKSCPSKPHYPTTKIQKTTHIQLLFNYPSTNTMYQ